MRSAMNQIGLRTARSVAIGYEALGEGVGSWQRGGEGKHVDYRSEKWEQALAGIYWWERSGGA